MPEVAQATLQDIKDSKQRRKLRELMNERVTTAYAFSFRRLSAVLAGLGVEDPEEINSVIKECVVAADEDGCKKFVKDLNDKIRAILEENELPAVRDQDPLGRKVDCLWYEHPGSKRFNSQKLLDNAVKAGISAKKAQEILDSAYDPAKPYTVVTVREVKEKE